MIPSDVLYKPRCIQFSIIHMYVLWLIRLLKRPVTV